MIKNLDVRNFKSLKHIELECKRINIFIGKPNTGKSNILESLGMLSHLCYGELKNFVRFENMGNLFYDENLDDAIEIKFDDHVLGINFRDGLFIGTIDAAIGIDKEFFKYEYSGRADVKEIKDYRGYFVPFKFYKFNVLHNFPARESDFLSPPFGENLLSVIMAHKELKSTAKDIFDPFGLKMVFKPQENKIEVLKQYEDILVSCPYSLVSDTLQRIVFYLTAILSNKDSILIFEEPEAHAFPYYTKYLAEIIASDKNQYFISTHNPYLLMSILEKTPKNEIGIFITYFEDYQTKVRPIAEEEMPEILDLDASVFFNLDKFLEQE